MLQSFLYLFRPGIVDWNYRFRIKFLQNNRKLESIVYPEFLFLNMKNMKVGAEYCSMITFTMPDT